MTQPSARAGAASFDRPTDPDAADAGPFDPYALPPDAVEEPPRRFLKTLGQVGPGLILAGAIVGTGELIATTHLGAKAGFVLLWLVLLSCFVKVFVQIELGRYAIASGKPTMTAFKEIGGVGNFIGGCWVVMMLMTQLQLGAMVGGVGHALHLAMPNVSPAMFSLLGAGEALRGQPELPWAVLVAVATCVLLAAGSYKLVETGSTMMVVVFTLGTILCVALLPAAGHAIPWDRVVSGLAPSLPEKAIPAAIAMFGITGVGAAELIAYPYWCIEKGYARKAGPADASEAWLSRARGWVRVMHLDAWVSMVIYTLATVAFFFLGAAVLYGMDESGLPKGVDKMTEALRTMYEPVLGSFGSKWFIVIGVIAVLYSTLYAATAANARALTDFLRVNRAVQFARPADRVKWVRRFCVLFPLVDLVLYLFVKNPVLMVVIGGFVQALMLPLVGAAALFLRYRRTDARLRPGRVWDVFLWASVTALAATAIVGLNDQRKNFMKWYDPVPAVAPGTKPG